MRAMKLCSNVLERSCQHAQMYDYNNIGLTLEHHTSQSPLACTSATVEQHLLS